MKLSDYKLIICDLDGCLISGDVVLPGAQAALEAGGNRLYIISNNSTDTPQTLSQKLNRLGLYVPCHRILLAGTASVDYVAQSTNPTVYMSATEDLKTYAQSCGVEFCDLAPKTVLLTRDTSFSYDTLTKILHFLTNGAELIVANPDLTHPGADGVPVPETGSLLGWIKACLPNQPYTVIGKPEIRLHKAAIKQSGVSPADCLCIGDNYLTDGEAAHRMGMDYAHVNTQQGYHSLLDLLEETRKQA